MNKYINKGLVLIFTAVAVVAVMTSCIFADEKVDLRLRLEKGQSYKIRTVQDMKIIQTNEGKQQTSTSKIVVEQIYDIEEVASDGNTWVKITYHSTSVKDSSQKEGEPMVWEEYDSSNPPNVIPHDALGLAALAGQSYSIMVSPQGHIKDMKGIESVQSILIEKIPAANAGEFGLNELVKEQINKEALNELMENKFAVYSDEPVGIGDSWQKKTSISQCSISNLFPQIVDTIYTLKERKDGIAIIDVFSLIQPNFETKPIEVGKEKKIQLKLSGDSAGTIELEESTGWAIRSIQNIKLNGQVIIQGTDVPQGMVTVPISIVGTITTEPY